MDKQELITQLKRQLAALEGTGPYEVKKFEVWNADGLAEKLGTALVRIDRDAWSWGYCTSETCNHNSHDPYTEGDVVWIACEQVSESVDGDEHTYATQQGVVFVYRYAQDNGYHYCPTARITI